MFRQEGRELHIDEIEDSYWSDELQGTLRGAARRIAARRLNNIYIDPHHTFCCMCSTGVGRC